MGEVGVYDGDAHLLLVIRSSRIRSNCAMTQRTFRCTPNARRKSQSWSTWSSGGVHAQSVMTAVRPTQVSHDTGTPEKEEYLSGRYVKDIQGNA